MSKDILQHHGHEAGALTTTCVRSTGRHPRNTEATTSTRATVQRRSGDKFLLSLVLTVPVVFWSAHIQELPGHRAPGFTGSAWIPAVLGTVVLLYGGLFFLKGAWRELKARLPGMMTALGISKRRGKQGQSFPRFPWRNIVVMPVKVTIKSPSI